MVDEPGASARLGAGGGRGGSPRAFAGVDAYDRKASRRALVAGMRSGAILDRSGKPYKPKTVRTYEHALETHIFPLLGNRKVSTLRRADVQGFVEEMRALGAAPSTVHNRLDPLRVIVRRAIDNDELLVDPCARLKMPIARNNLPPPADRVLDSHRGVIGKAPTVRLKRVCGQHQAPQSV